MVEKIMEKLPRGFRNVGNAWRSFRLVTHFLSTRERIAEKIERDGSNTVQGVIDECGIRYAFVKRDFGDTK